MPSVMFTKAINSFFNTLKTTFSPIFLSFSYSLNKEFEKRKKVGVKL